MRKVYYRNIWKRAAEIMDAAPALAKGTYARSINNRPCCPYGAKAETYCFLGALYRAIWEETGNQVPVNPGSFDVASDAVARYSRQLNLAYKNRVNYWVINDAPQTTKDDMLRVLRRLARTTTGYVEVEE